MKPGLIVLFFLALIFSGCSVTLPRANLSSGNPAVLQESSAEVDTKIISLQKAIEALSPAISEDEAKTLATAAVLYPRQLALRYELVSPPYLHNFLITVGLKERGLCYHWAGDLMAYLKQQKFKNFDLYRAVAEQGNLREHHSVVVTAKGKPFSEGIVLDPWRGSSDLYFEHVTKDGEYTWHENGRHAIYRAL